MLNANIFLVEFAIFQELLLVEMVRSSVMFYLLHLALLNDFTAKLKRIGVWLGMDSNVNKCQTAIG